VDREGEWRERGINRSVDLPHMEEDDPNNGGEGEYGIPKGKEANRSLQNSTLA